MANIEPVNLVFSQSPEVEFATNTFINVPIILQYDDTPMIEVVRVVEAGYTSQFRIHHPDGTYLAKVVGSRLHTTEAGRKANLTLRYPAGATVCELDGKPVFEIRRTQAAALKADAELWAPDGSFIRAWGSDWNGRILADKDRPLQLGALFMRGNLFSGCRIGIHLLKDGGVRIGCS